MTPKILSKSLAIAFSGLLMTALAPVSIGAENTAANSVVAKLKPSELTIERLYRAKSYFGQSARNIHFSDDGRYLAYMWNPFGENGSDLYVHDTQTGETKRITAPALMKQYDAPEDWDKFDKKAAQKEKEEADRQAKAEAQAAYIRGEKVDLNQWESAEIEIVKRELAEKKLRTLRKSRARRECSKRKSSGKSGRKSCG